MVLSIDSRGDSSRQFDDALTVQDRIRVKLNEFGAKHIPITIDEMADQMNLQPSSVYQALKRLEGKNEITFEKEETEGGRDKIVGINVIKLEPSNRTYRRAANRRSGRAQTIRPALRVVETETIDGIPVLPTTTDYLQKKLAIEEMKQKAMDAGLDPSVIAFEPDPMGEEAIMLLKLYTDLRDKYIAKKEELQRMSFDLEAEKRNVEYLQREKQESFQQELRQHARAN